MAFSNPFAFHPIPVTFWTTVTYLALLVPLIYIQETVPSLPDKPGLLSTISLPEAWADLASLTQQFHPANSHANDIVRNFLLHRLQEIITENGALWEVHNEGNSINSPQSSMSANAGSNADVIIFNDLLSNVTFSTGISDTGRSAVYFEGTNIYVYIRGTSDDSDNWWEYLDASTSKGKRLILVNAHYDSVPSGNGATDDGAGVVAALQLVRHFTTPGYQPRRGVVVLFNNAEEDFLLGASAFANSKLSPFIASFVNLEGAGAGGRAMLFRASDLEVMGAYRGSLHPFGSVVSSDSFKLGLIRSETDYRVWVGALGYRGLDIAFYQRRVRYHTPQDDRRHTSKNSIWHMLSSALLCSQGLSNTAGDRADKSMTDGVWFDIFGNHMVIFALNKLLAVSLAILIISPLTFSILMYTLYRADKDYLFRSSVLVDRILPHAKTAFIGGWKGFFRFPLALVIAGASLFGTCVLLRKLQPFILYGNLYTVMALMAMQFYSVFWSFMRAADFARPSAYHRTYAIFWLFIITWSLLICTAVLETRYKIASGYVIVFFALGVFLATFISLAENFALERKTDFCKLSDDPVSVQSQTLDDSDNNNATTILPPTPSGAENDFPLHDDDDDNGLNITSETSPLIGRSAPSSSRIATFASGYRRNFRALSRQSQRISSETQRTNPFGFEQDWSAHLPTWTWLIQFLVLGPLSIVLTAQLELALVTAVQQTGTDGSDLLFPYILVAAFSILLLLPITPFIHRVTHHIPVFFIFSVLGILIYCLSVFPFSAQSPYKFFIRQKFSIDTGNTTIIFTGYEDYVKKIMADLPSLSGRAWTCSPTTGRQVGLVDCVCDGSGLETNVEGPDKPFMNYSHLITVKATRIEGENRATLELDTVNSKSCALHFQKPTKNVVVRGSAGWDTRLGQSPNDGNWMISDISLWRRDWATPWIVDVEWEDNEYENSVATFNQTLGVNLPSEERSTYDKQEGKNERVNGLGGLVICKWADLNAPGAMPVVDEAWRFAPDWSIVSIRSRPAPVEGSKAFSV